MILSGVSLLPVVLLGTSELHGADTLVAETSGFTFGRSDTTAFTVLLGVVADPVDTWVIADGLVHWVNHDDFEPLIVTVLSNPV